MKISIPFPVVALVMVCLLAGCSGSTDSVSSDTQTPTNSASSEVSGDTGIPNDVNDVTDTDTTIDDANNDAVGGALNQPATNNPVVLVPLIQNTLMVNFDITVPAYRSSELRMELVWGDTNLSAKWVGDELWSAVGEFPSDTEHLLTVTFYDRNGEIELDKFSEAYRTSSNPTDSFQILADQFDASQFDDDGDGVNNLEELMSGTDPSLDEDSLLQIKDKYSLGSNSRMSVSSSFERGLSDDRPFFDTFERLPVDGGYPGTDFGEIDIDAQGNGTRTFSRSLQGTWLKLDGIRTNSGSAITWEGTRNAYDGDYGHTVDFTNTVTVVDDKARRYVEEIKGSNVGTYQFGWDISANLTGHLVDDTALCVPVAGVATIVSRSNYWDSNGITTTTTTISKDIDDPYWRVVGVNAENETSEYFVRELEIYRPYIGASAKTAPEFKYFICDFVDI